MTQKNFFGVVGTRTAHPGHIGAYCAIFNFSAKLNTFFKQIKFQTVDRHNAGQPIAHSLIHGARTTARRRAGRGYGDFSDFAVFSIYRL